MPMNLAQIVSPAAVAAAVSATALLAKELLGVRGRRARAAVEKRQGESELALRTHDSLLAQVQSLWAENASLREREAESRARCRELERTCGVLEQRCRELEFELELLRRRLDRFDRLLPDVSVTPTAVVAPTVLTPDTPPAVPSAAAPKEKS